MNNLLMTRRSTSKNSATTIPATRGVLATGNIQFVTADESNESTSMMKEHDEITSTAVAS